MNSAEGIYDASCKCKHTIKFPEIAIVKQNSFRRGTVTREEKGESGLSEKQYVLNAKDLSVTTHCRHNSVISQLGVL